MMRSLHRAGSSMRCHDARYWSAPFSRGNTTLFQMRCTIYLGRAAWKASWRLKNTSRHGRQPALFYATGEIRYQLEGALLKRRTTPSPRAIGRHFSQSGRPSGGRPISESCLARPPVRQASAPSILLKAAGGVLSREWYDVRRHRYEFVRQQSCRPVEAAILEMYVRHMTGTEKRCLFSPKPR